MSSVEGYRNETTASITIGATNFDDENTSGVNNHEELVTQMTNDDNNEFKNYKNQKCNSKKKVRKIMSQSS